MPRGPQPIGTVLADLMARTGFARVQSTAALETAWREAAGPWAERFTRVAALRCGKLEVVVSNSTFVQELCFQKNALLGALRRALPEQEIRDLRFRVGPIE
jgi:predicted nucleic acid-binding Zn ribbon protein